MKTLALTAAFLIGVSSAALAGSVADGTQAPVPGTVTQTQQDAIRAGVNNAVAVDPTIAPLGTNNAGAPITSTNPSVGNTPTATNTAGVNNVPGGVAAPGEAAGRPAPVTTGTVPR
jgi:hypothetical protein